MHVFGVCIVFIMFIVFIVLTPSPLTPTPLAFLWLMILCAGGCAWGAATGVPPDDHRDANGEDVNGEGVKTIKAIKTIHTPKTCMRTRKLSNSYRKPIEKLQFNDLRRIPLFIQL